MPPDTTGPARPGIGGRVRRDGLGAVLPRETSAAGCVRSKPRRPGVLMRKPGQSCAAGPGRRPRVMRSLLVMRLPFAYQALLLMGPGSDARTLGAAITLELCGSWDHDPPCPPLAAHHTRSQRDGDRLRVHVIFVCEPADETEVRRRIILALQAGTITGPDGAISHWVLRESAARSLTRQEAEQAQRLAGPPANP